MAGIYQRGPGLHLPADAIQPPRWIARVEDDDRLARLQHAEHRRDQGRVVVHQEGDPAGVAPIPPGELAGDAVGECIELLEAGLPGGPRDRSPAGLAADLLGESARDGLLGVSEGPGGRGRRIAEGPPAQAYTTWGRV